MKASCLFLTPCAVLALATASLAQTPFVLPSGFGNSWGAGSGSSVMLGNATTRTQSIFVSPFPSGTPIVGIGTRPTVSTADRPAFTADVEIKMSSTTAMPGSLSSTFANNTGTDEVTAFPRQMVNIPPMPANRAPGLFARFPFATPFMFGTNGAPNINVDFVVYSSTDGSAWSTDRSFASANGRAATAGQGCGSATIGSPSTAATYLAGNTFDVTLSSAPAGAPAVLQGAADLNTALPGVPLPFSLGSLGGDPACQILVNMSLAPIPVVADVSGAASVSIPIPASLSSIGTGWQYIYLVTPTAQNPLGLETTANRSIYVGPIVVTPDAQYVYDLTNATDGTGTATTNAIPIIEFLLP